MTPTRFHAWSRTALLAAAGFAASSCGNGTVTFGNGDGDNDGNATVTVKGNLDNVSPVTSREVVVFVYDIDSNDNSDRCTCPPNPSCSTQGKADVLASGETEFTLTGLFAGPLGVVFLLDNSGNYADGQIDPGDPIAVLDDVDCQLDDVGGNLTVTLKDVDIAFSPAPADVCAATKDDCMVDNPPAAGRARADQITLAKTTTGN